MNFKIGDKVKIKPLFFIIEEFHNKVGTVTEIKEFIDHTDGKPYSIITSSLDEVVETKHCNFVYHNSFFTSDCYELVEEK